MDSINYDRRATLSKRQNGVIDPTKILNPHFLLNFMSWHADHRSLLWPSAYPKPALSLASTF